MLRKNIYFDTGLCIKLATEISPEERRRLSQLISKEYTYCISPVTIHELLNGLAGANDFEASKKPLKILYGVGRRKFLPLPVVFVLKKLSQEIPGGIEDFTQAKAERWLRVVLTAENKHALLTGSVAEPGRKVGFGVNLHESREAIDRMKRGQINRIQSLQAGDIVPAPPVFWVNAFFRMFLSRDGTSEELAILRDKLDIVYQLECWIWKHTSGASKLNPERQGTLAADGLQLYYLADANNYFLTTDKDLKMKVEGSRQSSQIILWEELCAVLQRSKRNRGQTGRSRSSSPQSSEGDSALRQ